MRICLSLLAILILSACEEAPDQEQSSADKIHEQFDSEFHPVEPNGGIGDGAGPPGGMADMIPARFQGVWDYVEGTCARESDLRMEIGSKEILFYESVGTVTDVVAEGEDVIVSLAMEGEGETWEQKTRFSLTGEGDVQRLETSDGEQAKVTDEYPSKRCPE